jgi:hypothetical protein
MTRLRVIYLPFFLSLFYCVLPLLIKNSLYNSVLCYASRSCGCCMFMALDWLKAQAEWLAYTIQVCARSLCDVHTMTEPPKHMFLHGHFPKAWELLPSNMSGLSHNTHTHMQTYTHIPTTLNTSLIINNAINPSQSIYHTSLCFSSSHLSHFGISYQVHLIKFRAALPSGVWGARSLSHL